MFGLWVGNRVVDCWLLNTVILKGFAMLRFALTVSLVAVFAQAAAAQQACFAQNMCDFRGFACESDVDDCRAAKTHLRQQLAGAQSNAKRYQRINRQLKAENTALQAQLADIGSEETWARERSKIVGDYASVLICLRQADRLAAAKSCLDG